jgi:division protein CdvB (Snf7/Vps24/ESCRT-III family)
MKRHVFIPVLLAVALSALASQKSIEAMKEEADKASGGHQAKLCAELAEHLVSVADQQFNQGNNQQGQATVQDILKYASKARDAAIQSHDNMKQTEIHLRETLRRLEALKRTLSVDDRPLLDATEKKIEQFRQDLLDTMFPPKKKDKTS